METALVLAALLFFLGAALVSKSRRPVAPQPRNAGPETPAPDRAEPRSRDFARPFSHTGRIVDIGTFTDPHGVRHVGVSLMNAEGRRELVIRHPDMIRNLRDVDVRTEFCLTGMIRDGVPLVDHIQPCAPTTPGSPGG